MSDIYLVGVDGSEAAIRAAEFAAGRAATEGASLILVHGINWSPYQVITPDEAATRHELREAEIAQARQQVVAPLLARLGDKVTVDVRIVHGHPAEVLAGLANGEGAAQIFVGRHGHSQLGAALFGSVAFALVQMAPVPITVVP